ncbi:cadherin-like domain-containing protein, partial [Synechocystis salina LEGE 06155]|nr:cadherin-like domain-containing protein [Synechocystis salina LEGE 06155]
LPAHWGGIGIGNVNDKTRFHDEAVSTTGNHGFKGEIDDVQVYNQSFSDSNVNGISNAPKAPTVSDDQVVTIVNAPLTISIQDLISNDYFDHNSEFTITQIMNSLDGTLIEQDGEIIFTPKADFQGVTNFEYTIETQGGTDTGIVEINVKQASLGTNLATVKDWSTQIPFLDGFKSSRAWIPQKNGVWNTQETLSLDANGWITSLPNKASNIEYKYASTLLYRDLQGQYLDGTYIVLYDGDGVLQYGMDAVKNEALSTEGRDVIQVTPSNKGILLTLTETDRQNNGNYLRNIRVISQQFENSYQTEIFNPAFVEKINPFSTLRFMDWMETNNSTQKEWQNRPTLNNATWAISGVPVEIMVELANKTSNDPWFTIPHQATDEYVREFATYVRDNLNPELKIYVEYSNEVWNPQFEQHRWIEQEYGHVQDGYSQRLTEVLGIWEGVFAQTGSQEDVIGVASGQAGNDWVLSRILQFAWADQPLTPQEYGIDAIAIAPYFAGGKHLLDTPEKVETIKSWIHTEADGGVTKLFDELNQGGLTGKTALEFVVDLIIPHQEIAQKYDLDLLAYEGGQHLVKEND